jgi:hypothetical protein
VTAGVCSTGDELSHPITVLSADFDACILPDQQTALVKATLVVTNEHVVGSDIKATLRFPLPDGAVVSGFQLQIGEDMVDAMCVTKKKAAAVAYKEKEAGRAVATTEAVQGSIWSTEVFPLPHGAKRTVALTFRCECPSLPPAAEGGATGGAWGLALPLSFAQPVGLITTTVTVPGTGDETSVTNNICGRAEATTLDGGLRIAVISSAPPTPAIRIGNCPKTGERHFSMLVPAHVLEEALAAEGASASGAGPGAKAVSVGIVWDISGSRQNADKQLLALIDQLAASTTAAGATLALTVHTLSTELQTLAPAGQAAEARAAVAAQLPLTYDGGTDLSLLDRLAEGGYDYIILASDGIDNFHRRPAMATIPFPCYVALAEGGVHGTDSSLLQGIARLSGGVCMPLARSSELVAIASGEREETTISSLKLTGLEEDALFDESLATVPDARIMHGRWALLDSGAVSHPPRD